MVSINGKNIYPNRVEELITKSTKRKDSTESVAFVGYEPLWRFNELVLDEKTKQELKDAIVFCNSRSQIITEWKLDRFLKGSGGCTGINMYGEPGTGKSISAEAIASETGSKIIKVDYSEIQDSLFGGTEKKLTELFKSAEESNSIIFFDESDSLLGKRKSDGPNSENNNQIKSHLLTLLDRSNVIVIFATNLFEHYDRAFFRRILFHINIPLPKYDELIALWKFQIGDIPKSELENAFSYEVIAEYSKGLSGGDLKNLTLKLCIRLASRDDKFLTNSMILEEIDTYKRSLNDMNGKNKDKNFNTKILEGEEKENAKKMLDEAEAKNELLKDFEN